MQSDIFASWARSSAICSRDTCVAGESEVWWLRKGAYEMHCTLLLGSIGACFKLAGMPSHHHPAAMAPRDIKRSVSGVRRETSSVSWQCARPVDDISRDYVAGQFFSLGAI